jgi:hypothetical protein
MSSKELKVANKILAEVRNSLSLSEFLVRVDFCPENISAFLDSININESTEQSFCIFASLDQTMMLNNIFNEACNGVKITNFNEKIGIPKEEAKELLEIINKVMNDLYSLV